MKNVLVVYSSLNPQAGNSTKLAAQYVDALKQKGDVKIVERDLMASSLDHLSAEEMGAWMTPEEQRTDAQRALAAVSESLIEEVKQADEIVLAVPMYNFGVPSVLKAWFDRIARAGITFRYTENGPVGLLENKTATVLAARGGMYAGTPKDSQTTFIKDFLAFIGITDVRFVYAEGLAMGEETASKAFSQANEKIIELTAA
ncbi:FMN-dependent NADH-azoreductase [Alteromonas sp. CYL-A6]|uniref:FMN-dependent NADH-azoreductase n=1 Tax=Alteromonas nitratireducens TaxID=3390813 RepID=UPI0034A7B980